MEAGSDDMGASAEGDMDYSTDEGLHYNFVFLFAHDDFARALLGKELYEHPQVRVRRYAFDGNPLEERLFHLHTAYSVNEHVNLPLKSIWFRRMYEQGFDNDLPTCFVYLGGNMVRYDGGFCDYVRKRDSRNRVAMIHWDLIKKKVQYDYTIILGKVDLAITYDEQEAREYGIHFFQETTYSRPVESPAHVEYRQDIYFLGAAKDRLEKIYSVFSYLSGHGVRCRFQIAGVSPEDRVEADGLEYVTYVPYEENVRNVIESKCILDVAQGGSGDITARTREAISYGRRLVTDCPKNYSSFFNDGQLIRFSEARDIDCALVLKDIPEGGYPQRIDLNPMKRLYDIQEQLDMLG